MNIPNNFLTGDPVDELHPPVLQQIREYAVVLLDPRGTIVWLSPSAVELFGHEPYAAVGRNGDLLFTPEDVSRGVFVHEMETAAVQGSMENDRWMMRADGSRFWAEGVMFPLRAPEGTLLGFSKMLRDRTDLMQQLRSLRNEIAALMERSTRKDSVLAVAAHELRNPLFAMSVAVDTIRRSLPDGGKFQPTFDAIDRQMQAIRRILDDVTDATEANTGKLKLRRERVDLRDIIQRAMETLRPTIELRRHTVSQVLLPVAIPVIGDPDRLQQIIQNLIDNAVKYTPSGGRIGVEATIEANEAVLKIEDNGIGVAPDMQTQIFELFTQAHDPARMDEKGLGIGLALVRNLVLQHDGTVQVRSNGAGKGSEFTVRLPLAGAE